MSAAETTPQIKGWCPGAHRPMMSGDGLVVRVRPFFGALDAAQVRELCAIAERFGNGVLDLTSRANLQIRGVAPEDHPALLSALDALGLIDADPAVEGHRNMLMPPIWTEGDRTHRLAAALLAALPTLPELPEKMGFAIDTADRAYLTNGSADFRFEQDANGGMHLRADGASGGRPVTESTAMQALAEMVTWFVESGGRDHGRMARHLPRVTLPEDWTLATPRAAPEPVPLGAFAGGTVLGAPFGKIPTTALRALMQDSGATQLRLMLGRCLFLPEVEIEVASGFVAHPSRLMQVHACPGAPFCPQASVETMDIVRRLADQTSGTLHVSGCSKGCAFPRRAATTLVGREGRFDLVLNGQPWDAPRHRGLSPADLNDLSDLS